LLFMRETGLDWGYMAAAATIMMVPMLLSTVFVQRGLVRGLTMGAVKSLPKASSGFSGILIQPLSVGVSESSRGCA
jgi:hypothetical protein